LVKVGKSARLYKQSEITFNKWKSFIFQKVKRKLDKSVRFINRAVEQFNGRDGETATFFWHCPLNLNGLGGGFAPRQRRRWASSLETGTE
jgi:hypothetical protein